MLISSRNKPIALLHALQSSPRTHFEHPCRVPYGWQLWSWSRHQPDNPGSVVLQIAHTFGCWSYHSILNPICLSVLANRLRFAVSGSDQYLLRTLSICVRLACSFFNGLHFSQACLPDCLSVFTNLSPQKSQVSYEPTDEFGYLLPFFLWLLVADAFRRSFCRSLLPSIFFCWQASHGTTALKRPLRNVVFVLHCGQIISRLISII